MGHSIFVTGTDTGVGKTFFTTGMIRILREFGIDTVGFKPIECGGRDDSTSLKEAAGDRQSIDEVNPVWFDQPLSPMAACDSPEDLAIDRIREAHSQLKKKHELVLVEGAGGWLVPLTPDFSMADLAVEFCDEVIIVAENRLGVLNHVFLTHQAVRNREMDCARVILNHPPRNGNNATRYGPLAYPVESFGSGTSNDLSLSSNAEMIETCLPTVEVLPMFDSSSFSQLVRTFIEE